MRTVLTITLLIVMLAASSSHAQQPSLQIFYDSALTETLWNCNEFILDTLYVIARDVNTFVVDIAYKIDYGAGLVWLGDIVSPGTAIGYSAAGIEIQYPRPINFVPLIVVQRAIVFWTCNECFFLSRVSPVPHPSYGELRVTEYPGLSTIALQPLSARVCRTLDTESSSWGRIKALYRTDF